MGKSNAEQNLHKDMEDIMLQLIEHGLEEYMNKFYNEEKHENIIEIIFEQIILKRFEN